MTATLTLSLKRFLFSDNFSFVDSSKPHFSVSSRYITLEFPTFQPIHTTSQASTLNQSSSPLVLCDLLTLPKYCRQGAATLLLKWGLHQATEANLPVYLTASPSGLPLYTKHNFRSVRKVPIYRPLNSTTVLQVNTGMILDAPHPSSPPTVSPADAGKFFLEPVTQEADFHKMAKIESLAFTEEYVFEKNFPLQLPTY